MDNKDIFDKLIELPILIIFKSLYKKYKEILLYLFFGLVTTVADYIVFFGLDVLGLHELLSNGIAWVISVVVAFITNRTFVFKAHSNNIKKEFIIFSSGRISTLLFDELMIYVFITILNFNKVIIKILSSVLVIIANYVISKFLVFKNRRESISSI